VVLAGDEVTSDPVKPRQRLRRQRVAAPPGDHHRLRGDVVGAVGSDTASGVGVHAPVVRLEDRGEGLSALIVGRVHAL
jgi:hypothetical protein